MQNKLRIFVAVRFPHNIQTYLEKLQQALKNKVDERVRIKWVECGNIHLTLQFLGSADTNLIPKLEHGFTSAFSNAILPNVTLKGVGAFPSSERPRVVWAGIQKGIEELKVLQQRVYKITVPLGFVAETRPFSPHVTLGRVKYVPKGGTLTRVLDLFSENYEAQCCINTVHLVKSELRLSGPIYTTLATFPVRDNNSQKNKEGI